MSANIHSPILDLHKVPLPLCTSELKGKGGISMYCTCISSACRHYKFQFHIHFWLSYCQKKSNNNSKRYMMLLVPLNSMLAIISNNRKATKTRTQKRYL